MGLAGGAAYRLSGPRAESFRDRGELHALLGGMTNQNPLCEAPVLEQAQDVPNEES